MTDELLKPEDMRHDIVRRIREHCAQRLQQLRAEGDNITETVSVAKRVGRVAEIKQLLRLLGHQGE